MQSLGSLFAMRRFAVMGAAILLGAATAMAQGGAISSASHHDILTSNDFDSSSYSSSADLLFTDSSSAEPAAPASPAGGRGGQYDNRSRRGGRQYSFQAGAGFNAPIGNDIPFVTWGGNFLIGGGLKLSPWFSLLGEYGFIQDKLPGALVAAGQGDTGNTRIQSLTLEPVVDLFPKKSNSVYLVGGGGWYHKSTNWNVLIGYDFYGYPVYATASTFSSNQGGVNGGFGFTHRLGGVYGDGTAKLFAEARYLWINSPKLGEPNGLGTTGLIPVSFGVRW
jgi:Outer membrane protein beta-barrel domain